MKSFEGVAFAKSPCHRVSSFGGVKGSCNLSEISEATPTANPLRIWQWWFFSTHWYPRVNNMFKVFYIIYILCIYIYILCIYIYINICTHTFNFPIQHGHFPVGLIVASWPPRAESYWASNIFRTWICLLNFWRRISCGLNFGFLKGAIAKSHTFLSTIDTLLQ